tara:strand:- start:97 stop:489 length:393 start_codon:yes stop_codon:yes gene_type:complete
LTDIISYFVLVFNNLLINNLLFELESDWRRKHILSDTYTPCDPLSRAIQEGAKLIDVRSAAECAGGMLPGAINLPLDENETALERLDFDRTLLLYCRSGQRSELARQKPPEMGHRDCRNIGLYSTFERCA